MSDAPRIEVEKPPGGIVSEMKCRHFNGVQNDTCKAGVVYRAAFPPPWPKNELPCISEPCPNVCEKRDPHTTQELADQKTAILAHGACMLKANAAVRADAKAKGLKRGAGGQSTCPCPLCGATIRYSVASVNGHVWAACETPDCVRWIE